jgi:hypothetical protein
MSPVQVIIERLDFFLVKFREIWPGESPGAKVSSMNIARSVKFVIESEWNNFPSLDDHQNAQLLRGFPRSLPL